MTSPNAAGESYRWSPATYGDCPSCAVNGILLPYDTLISLTLTSAAGCVASDSLYVRVDDSTPRSFIPTAFSPNGDGTNDRWVPGFGGEVSAIADWRVYDRWGTEVWSYAGEEQNHWDGGNAGAGVYLYTITLRLISGELITRTGEVLILR
nr:gliding motility-associated C-terminal domain-containing protein [Lewinella sp. JB7]